MIVLIVFLTCLYLAVGFATAYAVKRWDPDFDMDFILGICIIFWPVVWFMCLFVAFGFGIFIAFNVLGKFAKWLYKRLEKKLDK